MYQIDILPWKCFLHYWPFVLGDIFIQFAALKFDLDGPIELFTLLLGTKWGQVIINSLAPGGFNYSLKLVNFKLISMINISSIFYEIAIRWMPQHLPDH